MSLLPLIGCRPFQIFNSFVLLWFQILFVYLYQFRLQNYKHSLYFARVSLINIKGLTEFNRIIRLYLIIINYDGK